MLARATAAGRGDASSLSQAGTCSSADAVPGAVAGFVSNRRNLPISEAAGRRARQVDKE